MYLNRFIFPAPQSSYSADILKDNLVWVQRPKSQTKPSKDIFKRPEADNHGIQLDPSSEMNQRASLDGFESFKRSEIDPEFGLQSDMFLFNSTAPRSMGSVGGFKSLNTIDVEKPCSLDQLTPEQNIPEFRVNINDYPKEEHDFKKHHKGSGGCFGFFSKPKSKSKHHKRSARNEGSTVCSTRTSDVSAKRDMMRSEPDLKKPRSLSIEPLSKSVNLESKNIVKIPCLHLKCSYPTTKTLLFFHSNGEDIYLTYELLKYISEYLLVNVFAVEYPGYGIYKGSASEKNVLLDAEAAYSYLINNLGIKEEEIMIAGRSLGSGPATWLASFTNPSMLILISPFTSIKAVVNHAFGKTAQLLIKERFNNLQLIPSVKCPVFILHGKNDTLIPPEQANKLYGAIKGTKKLHIADDMDHGSFDFFNDLIMPLMNFMDELRGPPIIHQRRSRVMPRHFFRETPVIEIESLK